MRSLLLSFCLGLTTAGCVASPAEDSPAVGTEAQAINAGTVIRGRHEIARVRVGGAICTATLISPRYAVTAGHCVSRPLASGDRFELVDGDGITRFTSAMERVHFLSDRMKDSLVRWGEHDYVSADVALVRLASAASASVATPTPLGGTRPTDFSASTTWIGWCRTSTGFEKRTASVTSRWAPFPCPESIGAPGMWGSDISASPIFGVIVGVEDDRTFPWDPNFAPTITGDAAYYKKIVEGLMQAWDGDVEYDVDRFGADYRSMPAASSSECNLYCYDDRTRCRAYTFLGGTCYLKDARPSAKHRPGAISRISPYYSGPSFEEGYDRPGGDYRTFNFTGGDRACADVCASEARCQAFTILGPRTGSIRCTKGRSSGRRRARACCCACRGHRERRRRPRSGRSACASGERAA